MAGKRESRKAKGKRVGEKRGKADGSSRAKEVKPSQLPFTFGHN